MKHFLAVISIGAFILNAHAGIDDSDLSSPPGIVPLDVPAELPLDKIESADSLQSISVEILREDHERLTPVSGLTFSLNKNGQPETSTTDLTGTASFKSCPAITANAKVTAIFSTPYFSVGNGRENFRVTVPVECGSHTRVVFKSDSSGGQALGIWQVAWAANKKMEASTGLSFWNTSIEFVWPADGDYYSFGSVHLTRGDHWDVVGHEMGHAIYDLGKLGAFGGGPHKIDQCYGVDLALSEGWASFFSAWVSLDLGDPDAKFEFMVPRRAPIRFENVPADVCRGESNEWRVTAFFWDLIDLHQDGELAKETFGRAWLALKDTRAESTSEARRNMERAGFDPEVMKILWALDF